MSNTEKSPLLSIIVPVFNSEKYIAMCLKCLSAQTYSNVEIIAVNDGSTDNSANLIEEIVQQDSRVILLNQNNHGVSAARNSGIKFAHGDYITFVDADDSIDPNAYETIINRLAVSNAEAAIYAIEHEFESEEQGKLIDLLPWDDETVLDSSRIKSELIPNMLSGSRQNKLIMGSAWRFVFRKEIGADLLFDEELHIQEDLVFCVQLLCRLSSLLVLNCVRYHYVKHSNSTLEHYWPDFDDTLKKVDQALNKVLDDYNLRPLCKTNLCLRKIEMYSLRLSNLFRNDSPPDHKGAVKMILVEFINDDYLKKNISIKQCNKKLLFVYFLLCINSSWVISHIYREKELLRTRKAYTKGLRK